ncbi:glycoside hydrolase family 79 protein [Myriangium duriaei CBS 260.36]|uniref:Glycoside hydrolase family 79 protein n=1 Tax=Myriangium duriaei CBS 260.36 TaxID=1168546 RepID=A0A9P4MBU1_9PEZI|nr:glycoside hydrolase family 79 protein [Myriangium duriaei CBS 260.36]
MILFLIVATASVVAVEGADSSRPILVPTRSETPTGLLGSFVSISYELRHFPAYAVGSRSEPNGYSINLLKNIAERQIHMPVARVGGNSQDEAIYDDTLTVPLAPSCTADSLAGLCLGKTFFDSYGTFPNTKYSHGFNLAWNNASGYRTLEQTVALACHAINASIFDAWEYGNEPNLYRTQVRPKSWTTQDYILEWFNGTVRLASFLQQLCPNSVSESGLIAPSLSNPWSEIHPADVAASYKQDSGSRVTRFSMHAYMGGATSPTITLANTLLNHSAIVNALRPHVSIAQKIHAIPGMSETPYIIGECNSLWGGGRRGVCDVFGSALWVLDFTLHAASTGQISRLHFHQGPGAPYTAWNPSGHNAATFPSYYGKVAAAQFIGDSTKRSVSAVKLPEGSESESAYASYDTDTQGLATLAIINMNEYNSTAAALRPTKTYTLNIIPQSCWTSERLTAPGSDSLNGITFGGLSFEYLTLGRPHRQMPSDPKTCADDQGNLTLRLQDSEAIILSRQAA